MRACTGRILREYQSTRGNLPVQGAVADGIWDVDPSPQNGDSSGTLVQRSTVRFGIDAARHSTNHRHAGAGESEA